MVSGIAMIIGGVLVLGYVGWQYLGTNWVSHRTQADIVEKLHKSWDSGQGSVKVDQGEAGTIVRIPRFGDDYQVPVIENTSDDALAAGFGHFEGTAGPGEVGNYALAAHRITHGQPLAGMPDLEIGDQVIVETADTTYTYKLTSGGSDLRVPFTAGWVIDPLPVNPEAGGVQPPQDAGEKLLTLTTCAELFHTDDRLVAFGILVDQQPR